MIKTKKDLKEFLIVEKEKYNLNKYFLKKLLGIDEQVVIWKYQKSLRKYEYHLNSNHKIRKLIYKVKTFRLGNKYGFHIAPNTIEKGLKIMHLGSILINKNAKIGENCSLHINTAIVAGGRTNKAPNIGNNCIIAVGSTILGDIFIGDNCVIGAGAVVNKSFEENDVTIAGVPAKIISKNNSDSWRK